MESIKRTTLMDTVTEHLRNSILNGEIGLGERVNESVLTDRLQVSRTTMREAMRQLEQAGLLVRVPFKGTFVREFTKEEVKDLNKLRGVLETYAAEIILEKGLNTENGLKPLYDIAHKMVGIDFKTEAAKTNELHISFHRMLLDMAGNQLLYHVWSEQAQQFWVAMRVSQLAREEEDDFAEAHLRIVDVLASGDMDQIRETIRSHIT